MHDRSPASPEVRAARGNLRDLQDLPWLTRPWEIARRVAIGTWADGFIHAGNLAYLALVSVFPFFIVLAALAHYLGQGRETMHAVDGVLRTLPRAVRILIRQPVTDVLAQRTGSLLWLGGLLGLWTTGSFIETIRDILRRAYGVRASQPFWRYRLLSAGLIVGSVMLMLVSFALQLALVGVEQLVLHLFPRATGLLGWIGWSRFAPLFALFVALYLIFFSLTPSKYRVPGFRRWPGAAFTTGWWALMSWGLPFTLARLGGYDRTYGSLAGVVVALLFFYLVGFGLVVGAHLNAALAETPKAALRDGTLTPGQEG
jgi:membrane protein